MTGEQGGRLPLAGVRVLDLTGLLPGPFASQILVDLGAGVLKVERPGGDPMRLLGEGVHAAVNRGKRSVVLDLKAPADRAVFLDLVAGADVVMENNRPGVLARLGLGFDVLRARRPGLVLVSLSGWGQDGPLVRDGGHNVTYLARAGATFLTGDPGSPPSDAVPIATADLGTSLYAVIGILAALRSTPPEGVHLDVSLFGAALALMGPRFAEYVSRGGPGRDELLRRPAHGTFRTGDGRYLTIAAVEDHFWTGLCRAIDRPDLAERADLGTYAGRIARTAEVDAVVGAALATGSRDHWVERLRAHDVPVSPVLEPPEVAQDAQTRSLGAYASWPDVRAFFPVTGLPGRVPTAVADVDEHGPSVRRSGWDAL